MIEHLGDLLRLSLESRDRQEIPLAEELAFLDHYLAIQRIRFGDHLKLEMRDRSGRDYAPVPSSSSSRSSRTPSGTASRAAPGAAR